MWFFWQGHSCVCVLGDDALASSESEVVECDGGDLGVDFDDFDGASGVYCVEVSGEFVSSASDEERVEVWSFLGDDFYDACVYVLVSVVQVFGFFRFGVAMYESVEDEYSDGGFVVECSFGDSYAEVVAFGGAYGCEWLLCRCEGGDGNEDDHWEYEFEWCVP